MGYGLPFTLISTQTGLLTISKFSRKKFCVTELLSGQLILCKERTGGPLYYLLCYVFFLRIYCTKNQGIHPQNSDKCPSVQYVQVSALPP